MTPKEKAEEILSHYNSILIDEISHGGARGYASYKCALIAVDEILNGISETWEVGSYDFESTNDFWQAVKREIDKL